MPRNTSTVAEKLKYWLKEIAIAAVVFAAVYAVMVWVQKQDQKGGGGALPVGTEAAAFELPDARSKQLVSLASLRGKPTILNFWATWCGSCRVELPDLQRVHDASEGKFNLVTISAEPSAKVLAFMANHDPPLSLPLLTDRTKRAHRAYEIRSFPTTVILDGEGRIVHDFSGPADADILLDHMERLAD